MDKRINIIKKKKPVKTEPNWTTLTGSTMSPNFFISLNKKNVDDDEEVEVKPHKMGPGTHWYQ